MRGRSKRHDCGRRVWPERRIFGLVRKGGREMQTIELNGRPLAVMGGDRDAVEEFAEGDGFRADLLSFVDEDGRNRCGTAKACSLTAVRDPLPEEAVVFERSFA